VFACLLGHDLVSVARRDDDDEQSERFVIIVASALLVGLAAGLALTLFEIRGEESVHLAPQSQDAPGVVVINASYAAISREEMIAQADVILVGRVTNVSPTRFNQDSGEYWEDTNSPRTICPIHQIEIAVLQTIVDTIGVDDTVVVTVWGNSPLERPLGSAAGIIMAGSPDHNLEVGDQVIAFLGQRNIAWRDGTRPVLMFMGFPAESYLVLGSDGLYHDDWLDKEPVSLEALIAQVAQKRTVLAQP